MRSLFAPLKLDADSKKLHLVTELDRTIDDVRFFPTFFGTTIVMC